MSAKIAAEHHHAFEALFCGQYCKFTLFSEAVLKLGERLDGRGEV